MTIRLDHQVVGEKLISPLLAEVDPIRMAKINEFYEKAVVKYPAPPGGHPTAKAAPGTVTKGTVAARAAVAAAVPPIATEASAEKPKLKAKPSGVLIVNKGCSTKGIKSKTDCGRAKTAGPAVGGSRGNGGSRNPTSAASMDDLLQAELASAAAAAAEPAAPTVKRIPPALKPKSILPPKSAAPKVASAKSKTDCGLRKTAAASTSSLDRAPAAAPAPLAKQSALQAPRSGGLRRTVNGSASTSRLPSSGAGQQSFTRSQSPLDEKKSEDGGFDDYSDEEYEQEQQVPPPPAALPMPPVIQSTPRSLASPSRLLMMSAGARRGLPTPLQATLANGSTNHMSLSPMTPEGHLVSHPSVPMMMQPTPPKASVNSLLADMSDSDHQLVLTAIQTLHQALKSDPAASLAAKVSPIIFTSCIKLRVCRSLVSSSVTLLFSFPLTLPFSHQFLSEGTRRVAVELYMSLADVLGTLFRREELGKRAQVGCLAELMPTLISVIIEPAMEESPEGKQVSRQVNILTTDIVKHADQGAMMCALLQQLHSCISSSPHAGDSKFTEMVMKCLWKQTRGLAAIVNELDVDHVLLEAHKFLRDFPKEYWSDKKDVPFRTVRTIVYMLADTQREDVLSHLSLIPCVEETESFRYLSRILKELIKTGDVKNGNIDVLPGSVPIHG